MNVGFFFVDYISRLLTSPVGASPLLWSKERSALPIIPVFLFFPSYSMFVIFLWMSVFFVGRLHFQYPDLRQWEHPLCYYFIGRSGRLPFHTHQCPIVSPYICLNIMADRGPNPGFVRISAKQDRRTPRRHKLHFTFICLFITNLFTYLNQLFSDQFSSYLSYSIGFLWIFCEGGKIFL